MVDSDNQIQLVTVSESFSAYHNCENLDTDFPEEEEEEFTLCFDDNGVSLSQSNEEEEEEEDEHGFAADFYRSGNDWSSLRINPPPSDSKKLKQTDLFQMWGLKRHKKEDENENNKMKMKINGNPFAVKSNFNGGSCQPSSSGKLFTQQVRACPFYKKIPVPTIGRTIDRSMGIDTEIIIEEMIIEKAAEAVKLDECYTLVCFPLSKVKCCSGTCIILGMCVG